MRILIGLLAAMSVALAFVLQQLELYIAAGLLVLAVLLSWIIPAMRGRTAKNKLQSDLADEPGEDLESLGILSIKAVEPSVTRPQESPQHASETEFEPATDNGPEHEPEPPPKPVNGVAMGGLPDAYDANVLVPILEGIRAALGAHAVCVLRQSEDTYKVLGTAGQSFAKRAGDKFQAPVPLLSAERTFAIRNVVEDIPPRSLGYSYTAGSVRRIAVAPVGATPLILLADTKYEQGFTNPRTPELFNQCTGILRILFYEEDPQRPRHEIIADEMAMARAMKNDLALAIVVLRNSEHVSELGTGVIAQAETQLKERLQLVEPESRVVMFGELMFGVFLNGRRAGIQDWYKKLKESLEGEDGLLSSGIIVGVALLSDQHVDADSFRKAAKDALVSAYQQDVGAVISEPAD